LYFLKALMTIRWNSSVVQLKYLSLLGAYAQTEYPYHFHSVETNSELYGGAKEFIEEVDSLAAGALNDVLSCLKYLGDQRQVKAQALLSLEVFWEIINWSDISKMGNLALNLWNLAKLGVDPAVLTRSIESLRRKADFKPTFQVLCVKLQE